ncbi:MAG: proprotein convertase P-domain-containing protein [Polyangiaceae bacterium]|nr:proprotein convertase P-domain-containing protein [Polyangiaceae bacterium]
MRLGVVLGLSLAPYLLLACSLDPQGTGGAGLAGAAGAAGTAGSGGSGGAPPTGGSGGGLPQPCNGQCVDVNASCTPADVCECAGAYFDADGQPDTKASCVGRITSATVDVTLDHPWIGHVTIQLIPPTGTPLTLASRPGAGAPLEPGNNAVAQAAHPVRFAGSGEASAQVMGQSGGVVCAASPCPFIPYPDSLASLHGQPWLGTWKLCVGDSLTTHVGTLHGFELTLNTIMGPKTGASTPAPVLIPDGTFDNTQATMACATFALAP